MSVINQMLKDLDDRDPNQANASANAVPVAQPKSTINLILLVLVTIFFTLSIAAAASYFWFNNNQSQQSVVKNSPPVIVTERGLPNSSETTSVNRPKPQPLSMTVSDSPVSSQNVTPPKADPAVIEAELNRLKQARKDANRQPTAAPVNVELEPRNHTSSDVQTHAVEKPYDYLEADAEASKALQAELAKQQPRVDKNSQQRRQQQQNAEKVEASKASILDIQKVQVSTKELAEQSFERGLNYLKDKDAKKARSSLEKALNYQPDYREAQKQLAVLLYSTGQNRDAIIWLNKGIEQRPNDSEFRLMAAKLLQKAGQKEQAFTYLANASPSVIGNQDYFALQAGLAQQIQKYTEAKDAYIKLTQAYPEQSRFWLGLALSYEQLTKPNAAISAYRTSIETGRLSAKSKDFARKRLSALGG